MKKMEKFLFFYSIVSITVFFVAYGVFSPLPLNLISGVLMLPVVLYFWIRLTSPEATSAEMWSLRFFVSLATLSALGVFTFYLSNQSTKPGSDSEEEITSLRNQNEELEQNILNLKKTIDENQNSSESGSRALGVTISDFLYEENTTTPSAVRTTQSITAKPGVTSISVYKEASTNADKMANLVTGKSYLYISKSDGWYKIPMPGGLTGWVSATQVEEVQ